MPAPRHPPRPRCEPGSRGAGASLPGCPPSAAQGPADSPVPRGRTSSNGRSDASFRQHLDVLAVKYALFGLIGQDRVLPGATVDQVFLPVAGVDLVVAAARPDLVETLSGLDEVVPLVADDEVRTLRGAQDVVPAFADQLVAVLRADQLVVARRAFEDLRHGRPRENERADEQHPGNPAAKPIYHHTVVHPGAAGWGSS